ncbi:MAG: DUF4159 domain-containing protein [Pseudomonadota bacterium]
MDNFNFSWTSNFFYTALLGALGAFLWWLVRIKFKSFRLPILRVLDVPSADLPKLRTTPPPWFPFLCFLVGVLCLVGLTLKPSSKVNDNAPVDGQRVLVVLDLSPSVSSVITSLRYREIFSSFVDSLDGKSILSVVRTDRRDTIVGESHQAVKDAVGVLDFHSFGTKLGETLKHALSQNDSYTDIVIFSDKDAFSWSDLNWKFLAADRKISRVELGEVRQKENYFVKDLVVQSAPDSKVMEWTVGLGSTMAKGNHSVKVSVLAGEQVLAEQRTAFEGGEGPVSLSWPESKLNSFEGDSLRIQLDVDDAVAKDNVFQVSKQFVSAAAVVVGDTGGEQQLEDPAQALLSMLELLGIKVERRDQATAESQKVKRSFVINWLGTHGRDTCQLGDPKSPHHYWLIPETLEAFPQVCECFNKIELEATRIASLSAGSLSSSLPAGSPAHVTPAAPISCSNLKSPAEWSAALIQHNFFQMGGQLGSSAESLALRGKVSGIDVVAFQIPFTPLAGIPHGNWPLLVKAFVDAEHFEASKGAWPRVESLFDMEDPALLSASNVPYRESALEETSVKDLPSTWNWQPHSAGAVAQDSDDSDPLPWIMRVIKIVLIVLVAEIAFGVYSRLRLTMLALFFGFVSMKSEGALILSSLSPHPLNMQDFSKSLESRTSLSLETNARIYPKLTATALREPWLFVNDPASLLGPSGAFLPELEGWIRKGGILILQADIPLFQLEKFTSEGFVSTVKKGSWRPIAPDHELMRSFYLLDSLPACEGSTWQEYRYDGRTAILAIPFRLSSILSNTPEPAPCPVLNDRERLTRVLVNLFMVSLATDYKKDQIHLPEILKRLR